MHAHALTPLGLAMLLAAGCTVDRLGAGEGGKGGTSSGAGGDATDVATSAATGGVTTTSTSSSQSSTSATTTDAGAGGGAVGPGAGGGSSTGTGGGGGGGLVDECAEALDDCLRGERCTDLDDGFACEPVTVFILEESEGSGVVADLLTTLGATVIEGPGFADWDGQSPSAANADAIVWFEGVDWARVMADGAQQVIADHVAAGGGLVRTGWAVSSATSRTGVADDVLPVTYDGGVVLGATWTRDGGTFIGEAAPGTFDDTTMRWCTLTPIGGAAVAWHDTTTNEPLVVTSDAFGGRVVYVNHDVTYSGPIGPDAATILADAALYAAGLGD